MKAFIPSAARPVIVPALLWISSFVCALYPLNSYQMEFFGVSVLLLFAWSYKMMAARMKEGWSLPGTPVLWIAGAFWGLVCASVFWSDVKPASIMGLCIFSAMPLSFFVGAMAGDFRYFRYVAFALAPVFAVLSLWAVIQFFFLNAYFNGQAQHPLADPSSLGALFSLGLFCAMGGIVFAKGRAERLAAIILSSLLICGIMSTVARAPVFAFMPGFLVFAIALWPQMKERWKGFLVLAVVAGAFYGLMQLNTNKAFDLGERVAGTVTLSERNLDGNRLMLWKSTWTMIEDHPWLGTGIGTFFLNYPPYRDPANPDSSYLAHNDPLQFWAELGVAGPVLFYLFAAAAAVRSIRALRKNRTLENLNDRIMVAVVFAALTAMAVQSHVSFCHYNLSILMVAGFLLSVWLQASSRALGEEQILYTMPAQSPAVLNKLLLALPLLMLGWINTSIVAGESYVNRARDHLFAGDMFAFADDINKAGRVSLGLNYRAYLLAVNVPLAILDDRSKTQSADQQKQLYEQVRDYMERVIALNPHAGAAYYYLAQVQEKVDPSVLPKDAPRQYDLYKEALRLDPTHLAARLAYDRWMEQQGFPVNIRLGVLEQGLAFHYIDPLARDYYSRMARLYLEEKNYGKVQAMVAKAAAFEKRSEYSRKRQATTLPQAVMGDDRALRSP